MQSITHCNPVQSITHFVSPSRGRASARYVKSCYCIAIRRHDRRPLRRETIHGIGHVRSLLRSRECPQRHAKRERLQDRLDLKRKPQNMENTETLEPGTFFSFPPNFRISRCVWLPGIRVAGTRKKTPVRNRSDLFRVPQPLTQEGTPLKIHYVRRSFSRVFRHVPCLYKK